MNFKQSEIQYYKPGDEITFTDEQMKKISDNDKFFDDMKKMKEEIEDVLSKYGLEINTMVIGADPNPNNRGYISIRRKENGGISDAEAGVIVTDFNPDNPIVDKGNIIETREES